MREDLWVYFGATPLVLASNLRSLGLRVARPTGLLTARMTANLKDLRGRQRTFTDSGWPLAELGWTLADFDERKSCGLQTRLRALQFKGLQGAGSGCGLGGVLG
jgi:hypothetical protein